MKNEDAVGVIKDLLGSELAARRPHQGGLKATEKQALRLALKVLEPPTQEKLDTTVYDTVAGGKITVGQLVAMLRNQLTGKPLRFAINGTDNTQYFVNFEEVFETAGACWVAFKEQK